MSAFQPVFLPDDRRLNGRASQTMLRHYAGCPRSGFLYSLYKGEARTVEMVRGTALHAILERATRLMVDQGEAIIPPEVIKTLTAEVLSEQQVPVEEHDYIREMTYRWATTTAVDPSSVIACETLIVMDVAGYEVRMRVDFACSLEDGQAVLVRDYKSARGMPSQEDVARRRPDGTLAARNFQLVLYALGLAYGVPVRVEPCPRCEGRGWIKECPCGGRGHVEIREPFPLASRAQRYDLEFVYPGIDAGGEMGKRSMSLTRLELEEYRASLEAVLVNLARSEETGDWPAIVSDAACSECPASSLCPIPVELRDHRGTINTASEAAEAQSVLERRRAEDAAIQREVKAFVKANGGRLRFGRKVGEIVPTTTVKIPDRDGMFAAQDRAVLYGEPFDRSEWVKTSHGTAYRTRDLTVDELARSEGSNEGEDDGNSES
jgi:hypothetical protein